MEIFVKIDGFSNYGVSSNGNVINFETHKFVTIYVNTGGIPFVRILSDLGDSDQKMANFSLKRLVALYFVEPDWDPQFYVSEFFTTPIQCDGNLMNCNVLNIKWRTRSFAMRYRSQFKFIHPNFIEKLYHTPVVDVTTEEHFSNMYDACVFNGLLFSDFLDGLYNGTYVHPIRHLFVLDS